MNFSFLAEADRVALQLERSKRALEAAKSALESAKQEYDELLGLAEEQGIPRAKLRKLTDDRIQSLTESGILDLASTGEKAAAAPKAAPKPRKPKPAKAAPEVDFVESESEAEAASATAEL